MSIQSRFGVFSNWFESKEYPKHTTDNTQHAIEVREASQEDDRKKRNIEDITRVVREDRKTLNCTMDRLGQSEFQATGPVSSSITRHDWLEGQVESAKREKVHIAEINRTLDAVQEQNEERRRANNERLAAINAALRQNVKKENVPVEANENFQELHENILFESKYLHDLLNRLAKEGIAKLTKGKVFSGICSE